MNLLGSFEKLSLHPSCSPGCVWNRSRSRSRSSRMEKWQDRWPVPWLEKVALSLPQNAAENVPVPSRPAPAGSRGQSSSRPGLCWTPYTGHSCHSGILEKREKTTPRFLHHLCCRTETSSELEANENPSFLCVTCSVGVSRILRERVFPPCRILCKHLPCVDRLKDTTAWDTLCSVPVCV